MPQAAAERYWAKPRVNCPRLPVPAHKHKPQSALLLQLDVYIQDIYDRPVRFQFDPAKASVNLRKHGVSFADAEGVFSDPLALHRTDPDAEAEERCIAVGLGGGGELLVVAYTMRGDSIRLISVRRATRHEAKDYAG